MQEQIPVKKSRPIFDRRSVFFSFATLILFSVLAALIVKNGRVPHTPAGEQSGWTMDQMREYANRLKSDGLVDQAVFAYEDYLEAAELDGPARGKIYYSIGEMLLGANLYEDALSYFYKAEIADPKSDLKDEIGSYIVTCLERLGRGLDAEYQLESRTALGGEEAKEKAPGEVVARIGLREITMGEINAQLEKLPPWMKEGFTRSNERKLEFVEHYVAHELLFDKGMKLGIHRDPKVREQLQDMKKQIIIEQVIQQEITGKIQVDPDDLSNYYEAHKINYREPRKLKFKHIRLDSEEKAQSIQKRIVGGESFEAVAKSESLDEATKEKGGLVGDWISEKDPIPGIGFDETFTKGLFELAPGGASSIVRSEKGFHVVSVVEKKEAVDKAFEEVKQQVEFDYRRDKEARLTQELLMNLVNSKEVQIYANKFLDNEGEKDQPPPADSPGGQAADSRGGDGSQEPEEGESDIAEFPIELPGSGPEKET
ncbi:MAG: peptidyl-prolyl cis-trans isomerase [Candidatus Omnitrophica bacterium]|nr:peptidyl-prolyl cis-trans isomerase [Candidatus Omnitrophota bacterium]